MSGALEFWGRLTGIILIDLALAGDNALVIALAVQGLPVRTQVMGRLWGGIGAILLRVLFTLGAASMLKLAFFQAAGGILLLWIAFKLVRPRVKARHQVREGGTLLEAIAIIGLADMLMSLDNVLAVAAAGKGDLRLTVFGIALSLLLVMWGSGVLAELMRRHPWVVLLGGGVLGYVSGDLVLRDAWVAGRLDASAIGPLSFPIPVALAMLVIAVGWWQTSPPVRFKKLVART